MALPNTYSLKNLAGTFVHPAAGTFTFRGQQGVGSVNVSNATERTTHDVAGDGGVMVSYVAGDNGMLAVEVQQTSPLHTFLLLWYNLCKTAADDGDLSLWAAAEMHLRTILGGRVINGIGISPQKAADEPFNAQGSKVTWNLMCADLQRT